MTHGVTLNLDGPSCENNLSKKYLNYQLRKHTKRFWIGSPKVITIFPPPEQQQFRVIIFLIQNAKYEDWNSKSFDGKNQNPSPIPKLEFPSKMEIQEI